jgi:nicotinate-nucleotide pyrophosphorylase (carboxylating)
MNSRAQIEGRTERTEQARKAFFRGGGLVLESADYLRAVRALLGELLASDAGAGDLTVDALNLGKSQTTGRIIAREEGVLAGIAECAWVLQTAGLKVSQAKPDGDPVNDDETVLGIEGERGSMLSAERTALNLIQRMSGIATLTRRLQERVQARSPETFVVATRKTPWGLLDKRAVHLGGGGTHRLSLNDAILVKNNHLSLLAAREEDAVVTALERAWKQARKAAFVEIEVGSTDTAVAAARVFRRLQRQDAVPCARVLLLDNMSPREARQTIDALRSERLREEVLVEVSGNISESNLDEYASCGADALSMGALTHSPRALDLSLRTP